MDDKLQFAKDLHKFQEPKKTGIILDKSQQHALDQILAWYRSGTTQLFTMGGIAGSGKSTIVEAAVRKLREEVRSDLIIAIMAFTGKAASVIEKKSRSILGMYDYAGTQHSYMYKPVIEDNEVVDWELLPLGPDPRTHDYDAYPQHDNYKKRYAPFCDLIIIDEGSMQNKELFEAIKSYGIPILGVGDHKQLPPVGDSFSLMLNPDVVLEEPHRTAADHPIIKLSTLARKGIPIKPQEYGEGVEVLYQSKLKANPNHPAYSIIKNPSPDNVVIVGSNKMRRSINLNMLKHLRGEDFDSADTMPHEGDRLIVLRNNRNLGIYNGMLGVCQLVDHYAPDYPEYNFPIHFLPDDGGQVVATESSVWSYLSDKPQQPDSIKENKEYYKIKHTNHFDYAYAITCHKSQGSQWRGVVAYDVKWGDKDFKNRWRYTAITRSSDKLYMIV